MMEVRDISTNHRATRRAVTRRKDIPNQASIMTTSARRAVARRDHTTMKTTDTRKKMDIQSITDTKKNMERKVNLRLCNSTCNYNTLFYAGGSEHHKKWGHKKSSGGKGH